MSLRDGSTETVYFVRKHGEAAGMPDRMRVPLGTAEWHVDSELITRIDPPRPIKPEYSR